MHCWKEDSFQQRWEKSGGCYKINMREALKMCWKRERKERLEYQVGGNDFETLILISCKKKHLLFQFFKSCMLEINLKSKLLSNSVECICCSVLFQESSAESCVIFK